METESGETVANRRNIIQGQQDTALSETGEQQARLVGGRLQDEKFTHVYSSDLNRAVRTAQMILETNHASKCKMVYDSRLRERKFGNVEGKTYKDLVAAARRINTAPADFNPKGSENIQQVRERAVRFFHDLCEELRSYSLTEEGDYVPGSIKRRLGSHSVITGGDNCLDQQPSERSYLFMSSVPMNKVVGPYGIMEDDIDCAKIKRPRHGGGEGDNCDMNRGTEPIFPIDQEAGERSSSDSMTQHLDMPRSVIARSNSSSSSGYASLPEGTECQDCESDLLSLASNHCNAVEPERTQQSRDSTPCDIDSLFHPTVSDSEIKSSVVSAKSSGFDTSGRFTCPNVSLSPLLEHRLSSISSISSGRNSSFDDGDGLTVSVADVLLVSHGGFMKELIRHFIEDLGCKVPGGKGHALRVSPNTGLSRFTITVEENDRPVITCHQIHDKDHLFNMELPPPGGVL